MVKNKEFKTYSLNSEGVAKIQTIRECFDVLLDQLLIILPQGRELSLVRTKLEEASFFAIKATSGDESNHGVDTGY